MSRLILASASPRRRELLAGLGLDFDVRPVDIDESPREGEAPADLVRRLAHEKAAAIEPGPEDGSDPVVLAADTLVVLDGQVLGKPRDRADARRMLGELAGRRHTVLTGVELRRPSDGAERRGVASTEVEIGPLTDEQITWYVGTGEPMDKAGAYAIQGLGALLVESIRGNYTNVVGLPLPMVQSLMVELGRDLEEFETR